jgi:hypothetical protein
MIDPEEKEFAIAVGILEDSRKLIATGKIQRWDVVKWSVTVNIALAVAAAAPALAEVRLCLLILSWGVAYASWRLVVHYNQRMTDTQGQVKTVVKRLRDKNVDYNAIADHNVEDGYSISRERYDLTDFYVLFAILAGSPVLVLLSLFVKH